MAIHKKKNPFSAIMEKSRKEFVDSFTSRKLPRKFMYKKHTLVKRDGSINDIKLNSVLNSKDLKPYIQAMITPLEVQSEADVKKLYQAARLFDKTKKIRTRKLALWLEKILSACEKELLKIPEYKNGTAEFLFFRVLKKPDSRQAMLTAIAETLAEGFETSTDFIHDALNRFLKTNPGLTVYELFARDVSEKTDLPTAKPDPLDNMPDDGFVAFLKDKRDSGDMVPRFSPECINQFCDYWKEFYGVSVTDERVKKRIVKVDEWGRPLTRGGSVTKKDKLSFFEAVVLNFFVELVIGFVSVWFVGALEWG